MSQTASAKASAAWGPMLPDWIAAIAAACDAATMGAVADRLGYSRTTISLLVTNQYDRDLGAVERSARAILFDSIACPVLGDVTPSLCAEHQSARFIPNNPTRVALYRACRSGCAHSEIRGQETGVRNEQ